MATEQVDKAINEEVSGKVAEVAVVAAAQIDQANKDAEAIARAAVQSEHVARINDLEGRFSQWQREQTEATAQMRADYQSQIAELKSSIPPTLPSPEPLPPPIVEEVNPSDLKPQKQQEKDGQRDEQTKRPEHQGEVRKRMVL